MEFPANTVQQRDWFRQIYTEVKASYSMVYLDTPNSICLEQIAKRRIDQSERFATARRKPGTSHRSHD